MMSNAGGHGREESIFRHCTKTPNMTVNASETSGRRNSRMKNAYGAKQNNNGSRAIVNRHIATHECQFAG